MRSLINGIGSGFGRSVGRILGLVFIGFLIYFILNYFDIDLGEVLKWKNIL